MNKYKRIKFLKTNEVNGILEKDMVYNYWSLFKINRPVNYYILSREYIGRPDLLSLFLYGTLKYWWLILRVNNIDDIWNDMNVGDVLIVPNVSDYEDWLLKVIDKQRTENE